MLAASVVDDCKTEKRETAVNSGKVTDRTAEKQQKKMRAYRKSELSYRSNLTWKGRANNQSTAQRSVPITIGTLRFVPITIGTLRSVPINRNGYNSFATESGNGRARVNERKVRLHDSPKLFILTLHMARFASSVVDGGCTMV
jgi:hypothetical protein